MFRDNCLRRLLFLHSASGRRKLLGERLREAKAPPHGGDRGGPCFPAQSVIGLRDWARRKDWVGLPVAGEAACGRGFTWAWPQTPPLSVASKRTAAAGAGPEHGGRSQGGSLEPAVEQCPGGAEQVQAAAGAAGAGSGRGQGASRDHRGL